MTFQSSRLWFNGWRNIATIALLLAFAIRALVPTGYMPDERAAAVGSIKLVICSTAGMKTVVLLADGTPTDEHSAPTVHEPCALGGLLGALALAPVPDYTQIERRCARHQSLSSAIRHATLTAVPCLGARAPPLTV